MDNVAWCNMGAFSFLLMKITNVVELDLKFEPFSLDNLKRIFS
ncbi:MAG: hypothetical protein ACLTGI_09495 [Hoylesella buccalis]|nr:hypothetical protein [Hoylesella buccalis]